MTQVAGHLQEKKGYYYAVLSYKDENGRRKTKWVSTKLPVKGNKKRSLQQDNYKTVITKAP